MQTLKRSQLSGQTWHFSPALLYLPHRDCQRRPPRAPVWGGSGGRQGHSACSVQHGGVRGADEPRFTLTPSFPSVALELTWRPGSAGMLLIVGALRDLLGHLLGHWVPKPLTGFHRPGLYAWVPSFCNFQCSGLLNCTPECCIGSAILGRPN